MTASILKKQFFPPDREIQNDDREKALESPTNQRDVRSISGSFRPRKGWLGLSEAVAHCYEN